MEHHRKMRLLTMSFVLMIVTSIAACQNLDRKQIYEAQERCGKRAEEYFKRRSLSGVPGFDQYKYINHYNIKLNKCFILLTIRDSTGVGTELIDINENKQYGFSTEIYQLNPSFSCHFPLASNRDCKSREEWDAFVKTYMEE